MCDLNSDANENRKVAEDANSIKSILSSNTRNFIGLTPPSGPNKNYYQSVIQLAVTSHQIRLGCQTCSLARNTKGILREVTIYLDKTSLSNWDAIKLYSLLESEHSHLSRIQ